MTYSSRHSGALKSAILRLEGPEAGGRGAVRRVSGGGCVRCAGWQRWRRGVARHLAPNGVLMVSDLTPPAACRSCLSPIRHPSRRQGQRQLQPTRRASPQVSPWWRQIVVCPPGTSTEPVVSGHRQRRQGNQLRTPFLRQSAPTTATRHPHAAAADRPVERLHHRDRLLLRRHRRRRRPRRPDIHAVADADADADADAHGQADPLAETESNRRTDQKPTPSPTPTPTPTSTPTPSPSPSPSPSASPTPSLHPEPQHRQRLQHRLRRPRLCQHRLRSPSPSPSHGQAHHPRRHRRSAGVPVIGGGVCRPTRSRRRCRPSKDVQLDLVAATQSLLLMLLFLILAAFPGQLFNETWEANHEEIARWFTRGSGVGEGVRRALSAFWQRRARSRDLRRSQRGAVRLPQPELRRDGRIGRLADRHPGRPAHRHPRL